MDRKSLAENLSKRMNRCVEVLQNEFRKIHTGRPNPTILEHLLVDSYNTKLPLNQVASIVVGDDRSLIVTPWQKNLLGEIEKSITQAGLGLNPIMIKDTLRISIPSLTEERRKKMIKMVKVESEKSCIAVRNIRREFIHNLGKDNNLSEDELFSCKEEIQKITDQYIAQIDELYRIKEKELSTI